MCGSSSLLMSLPVPSPDQEGGFTSSCIASCSCCLFYKPLSGYWSFEKGKKKIRKNEKFTVVIAKCSFPFQFIGSHRLPTCPLWVIFSAAMEKLWCTGPLFTTNKTYWKMTTFLQVQDNTGIFQMWAVSLNFVMIANCFHFICAQMENFRIRFWKLAPSMFIGQ